MRTDDDDDGAVLLSTGVVGRELLLRASFSWPIGNDADAFREEEDDEELKGGSGDRGRKKEDMTTLWMRVRVQSSVGEGFRSWGG